MQQRPVLRLRRRHKVQGRQAKTSIEDIPVWKPSIPKDDRTYGADDCFILLDDEAEGDNDAVHHQLIEQEEVDVLQHQLEELAPIDEWDMQSEGSDDGWELGDDQPDRWTSETPTAEERKS